MNSTAYTPVMAMYITPTMIRYILNTVKPHRCGL